ncbi:HAD family hydrolase [Clostridium vincentii]|uniref:Sugar phosphatase YidA n=1 Tax=Clostridium vincentii TaxID=52704 RepID=A0A2T0BKL1_9CLOT|nr:HAD family hydrolase [Clostridium vincentii]PRR84389.1 Sugar phosphatase YidA [Clostridium vincentii]
MYKLIVSDLDETLLNDEHKVGRRNIEAIKKASELGVKFVAATGRGYSAIESVLKELDLDDKEKEYTISFNGCALTENLNSKMLSFNGLPFDKADELFKFGLTKDVCIHVYTAEIVYVYNLNEDEKSRFTYQKNALTELKKASIEFLRNTPIAKVIYQNVDVPYLKSFEDEMKPMTDDTVSLSYSSNRYMELNKIGVNKGNTMLALAESLGIEQEETIAVGDNYNDMSMLLVAGLSVAAGNAVQDIKDICGYTCENDNNEGVLAEVIEKFIL